ncbi:hypothetical protein RISK_000107 [Rhodopirellula islandica]|uniref:Uncharacterized protein n=1 Tax=Rhodopirellula islandica TaxID=595434 RepID=A0A0J1BNA5_RHOIS|nr:hypothetical protein RISK_000107 [Rhodopirellula islandica]
MRETFESDWNEWLSDSSNPSGWDRNSVLTCTIRCVGTACLDESIDSFGARSFVLGQI